MIDASTTMFIFLALKLLVLLGLAVYVVFAAVLVRQEQLMAHVLEEDFEPFLRLLTILHLAAAIGVVFLAFILL